MSIYILMSSDFEDNWFKVDVTTRTTENQILNINKCYVDASVVKILSIPKNQVIDVRKKVAKMMKSLFDSRPDAHRYKINKIDDASKILQVIADQVNDETESESESSEPEVKRVSKKVGARPKRRLVKSPRTVLPTITPVNSPVRSTDLLDESKMDFPDVAPSNDFPWVTKKRRKTENSDGPIVELNRKSLVDRWAEDSAYMLNKRGKEGKKKVVL